jgi:hypothetical protein
MSKAGIGWTIGALASLFVIFQGVDWAVKRLQAPKPTPVSIVGGIPSTSQSVSQKADFRITAGPEKVISNKPLIISRSITLSNIGDGIAHNLVLYCFREIDNVLTDVPHGPLGVLAPKETKTLSVYDTKLPDDVMHDRDGACVYGPLALAYEDPSGRHFVTFNGTGEATEVNPRPKP